MKLRGGKEWFTAAELADLALPGLPRAKRKVNERASAELWALRTNAAGAPLARPRQARGGGTEYHQDVLPAAARAALLARGVTVVAEVSDRPETKALGMWRWYDDQIDAVKAEAKRRLTTIQLVEAFDAAGMTRSAAVAAAAARSSVGGSTLWSWLQLLDGVAADDRLPYLAPRRGAGRGGQAEIEPRAWQLFLSDYLRPEKPTLAECYRRTELWAGAEGITLPHSRAFRRRLDRMDSRIVVQAREGAEALRRMLPAQQRSVAELHALEAVNIDGHKFDVFVKWPDGTVRRPMMVAIQDVYSRKMLAWRVAESENTIDTRLACADLFKNWGIPKHFLLDNGRAFASKWMTGGTPNRFRFKVKDDEPLGLLTALGITIHWATPYRGQSKPIERAFRDLTDIIARHPVTAGAYTGNRPDAKPENYGSAAVPLDVFRRLVDAGIAAHNAREGRRTETAHGRSFDVAWAESYSVAPIGKATPEQLRMALLTAEERPCDRRTGEISLEGNRYWSPELSAHAGRKLTVRFDPDDLHAPLHAYARDGAYICSAPAILATGFFDVASARERKKQEKNWRRATRELIEAEQLLDASKIAAMLPAIEPDEPVKATVVRPVRHRGNTAAALKPAAQALRASQEAAQAEMLDRMATGLRKLRAVT